MKRSAKSSWRIFDENQWESPSKSRQKPITRPNRSTDRVDREDQTTELVDNTVNRNQGETDSGRSQKRADQANYAHIAENWPQRLTLPIRLHM